MSTVSSVTVPLEFPVTVGGREYRELTLRRMKAKDTLIGEGESNEIRVAYRLFAVLAGVDAEVIEELDISDLETLGEKVAPLMGKLGGGLKIQDQGKAPSGEI